MPESVHSPQEALGPLQLSNSDERPPDMEQTQPRGSISTNHGSISIGALQLCKSPTKDASSCDPESGWTSGEATPVEKTEQKGAHEGSSTIQQTRMGQPEHPPLTRSGSSVMQVRKPEKGRWYSDARNKYEVTTKYFYQEIDTSWTVVMLVACYFVSGLIDAVAFGVWGVFVAMQTG